MEIIKVDTLHNEELKLKSGRAVGNSTRQIDIAVQLIFSTNSEKSYEVEILDHYKGGTDEKANTHLFFRVLARMELEHDLEQLVLKDLAEVNMDKHTIRLKAPLTK